MEQPAINRSALDYPRTPDGKYKYTTWDGQPLHFESLELPDLMSVPLFLAWLRKLFKRPAPSHRPH